MACILAETATMAFAILNIVLVSLSTASSLCVLGLWMVRMFTLRPPVDEQVFFENLSQLGGILEWITISLLSLVFSSFLVNGIIKRNSTQVKIYFIFGVAVSFFSLGALIAFSSLLTIPIYYEDLVHATKVSVLIVICIYVLILIMIRDTYKKFAKEEESNSPEKKLFIVSRLFKNLVSKDILTEELVPKLEKF